MEAKKEEKRRYDKEFKVSAVKLITEEGESAAEVARKLGIHSNLIYVWKKKYGQDGEKAFVGKGHLSELVSLRRKVKELEEDKEILKKAMGIFSGQSKEDTNS